MKYMTPVMLTLVFAGCAVEPTTENRSVVTTAAYLGTGGPTAAYMRKGGPAIEKTDELQPNLSDSPGFTQWGAKTDLWP